MGRVDRRVDAKTYIVDSLLSNFGIDAGSTGLLDRVDVSSRRLAKGESLFRAGDTVNEMFCVVEGWMTAAAELEEGGRQLLNFHVPIDIAGLEFISESRASSTMIAFKDSLLYLIPVAQFVKGLALAPKASLALTEVLGRRYITMQDRICVFSNGDAIAKIAYLLLGLRSKQMRNKFDDANTLRLPLTQPDIADALGLTPVTVSRAFTKLTGAGIVDYDRNKITILEPENLKSFVAPFLMQDKIVDEFG